MKLGATDISKVYLGSTEVSKAYLGSVQVHGGETPLPYDAEVEYLQTDGNQYIELPVYASEATDAIEIVFRRTDNTNQMRFCTPIGGESIFNVYVNGSGRVGYSYNAQWKAATTNDEAAIGLVRHDLKVDYKNKKITFDFEEFAMSGSSSKVATGYLGVLYGLGNPNFKGLIYEIKYWRNNTLLYDLIPVRKDNVGYFYDKINHSLYGNEGTGSFTIGYDKLTNLSDYTLLDYIENTNTTATAPYIDTGVLSQNGWDFSMEMTVKWNTISSSYRQLMGSDYSPIDGCDKGVYTSSISNPPTPSTTDFQTVVRNTSTYSKKTDYTAAPYALFRLYTCKSRANTTTTYICRCKLKAFKIKGDGVLVRDYVPVQHPSGAIGMFDKIENKFYASATSDTFTGS